MTDLPLHKVSETDAKLVLGHDPVPDAVGFRISPVVRDGQVQPGRWSHSWDGSRTQHPFAPGHPPYRVEALTVAAAGVWTGEAAPPPPPPPPPSGKPPAVRTNYAAVADGALDPLWQFHGRHTGPGGYIGAEPDPLGGGFRVQRHTVVDGAVFSGGERCEVLNTSKLRLEEGDRGQFRFDLLLPADFDSDSNLWNLLCQLHYSGSIAQSPFQMAIHDDVIPNIRVLGGPVNSNGTMGTVRADADLAQLTKGRWHTIGIDILMHRTDGELNMWFDGTQVFGKALPTYTVGGGYVYWKQGFYRSESSPATETYYFTDTLMWREPSADAMLGWVAS